MAQISDECIHGLTTAWCSTCREPTRRAQAKGRRVRRSWVTTALVPASYGSRCAVCGTSIEEGDAVGMVDDEGWCCENCVEEWG